MNKDARPTDKYPRFWSERPKIRLNKSITAIDINKKRNREIVIPPTINNTLPIGFGVIENRETLNRAITAKKINPVTDILLGIYGKKVQICWIYTLLLRQTGQV